MKHKKTYYRKAIEILDGFKVEQDNFNKLWDSQKYKEAYLFVSEFIKKRNIKISKEFKRADEKMYWLLR